LTAKDQITYNTKMAHLARSMGFKVGLKNALEIIPQLVDHFDFAINEQCFEVRSVTWIITVIMVIFAYNHFFWRQNQF